MRSVPVLVLLVLAPFVGEVLLGNLPAEPAAMAVALGPLMMLYGGGAVLIRETARRLGRGYPTMALLALAYALVEEGLVLGTLFNRDYLGLDLLENGWIPALGTSPVWTSYVLTIHTVWSMLVPIVLVERLFPQLGRAPWLRVPGTVAVAVLYVLGAALLAFGTYMTYRFVAAPPQLVATALLALGCVVAAVRMRRSTAPSRPGKAAPPAVLAAVCLLSGSVLILVQDQLEQAVPTLVGTALAIIIPTIVIVRSSRRNGWSTPHLLAALSGTMLVYCWSGFLIHRSLYGSTVTGVVVQMVAVLGAAGLLMIAWRRRDVSAVAPPRSAIDEDRGVSPSRKISR